MPASMRARAGAAEGRKRAEDGHKRKEEKREAKALLEKPTPSVEELAALRAMKPKKVNARDVERWFNEALLTMYGSAFITPRWGTKEWSLAKELLRDYGPDLVGKAVTYICEQWDDLVERSRGKLRGSPNIALLWGMRAMVFGELQDTRKRKSKRGKNSDEFNKDTKSPDVGW